MEQPQRNSEEIDLLVVVERAATFISRYKKILLVFTLIGGIVAVVIHKVKRKSYESTLILHSQLLTNAEEIAIVSDWNEMLFEEDYSALKTLMHCDDTLLDEVRSISAAAIQVSPVGSGFTIDVTVKNPAILPQLQKAIVYGLGNSEFVREKVEMRKQNITEMIGTLNKEIARIDSFDSYSSYNSGSKPGGTTVLNLSDTNSRRVILQDRLGDNRDALKFLNPIQVLQDFPINEKPRGIRLSAMGAIGAAAGLFIGFLVALYLNLKMSIAVLRKSRQAEVSQNKTI